MPLNPREIDFFNPMSRHIVFISYHYNDTDIGQEKVAILSGFLMAVGKFFFFMTAGHTLEKIDNALKAGHRLWGWTVFDGLSRKAKFRDSIPFDYERTGKFWQHDKEQGIDYGVIILPNLLYRTMSVNDIVPIGDNLWRENLPDTFDWYYMFGVPESSIELLAPGNHIKTEVTIIKAEPTEDIPDILKKATPRFYGKLLDADGGDAPTNIVGMSGGPIFGFKDNSDGTSDYWVIAVQSGWDKQKGIVAASFLKPIGEHIAAVLEEAKKQNQLEREDELGDA